MIAYSEESSKKCSNNQNYRTLKKKLKTLSRKQEKVSRKGLVPNLHSQIRVEIMNSLNQYQEEIEYAPPTELDEIISEYLSHSPLTETIEPTLSIIKNTSQAEGLAAIDCFVQSVYSVLNSKSGPSQVILYFSSIRFIFNEFYPYESDLNKYNDQNAIFLKKCEAFSHRTVRDLELAPELVNGYTPGLPISSLFKTKQLAMMDQMGLMTNPLDLMFHIHFVVQKLANNFGKEGTFLAFDDTLTLLIALIAINPPVNAISIREFMAKWENLQMSPYVKMDKDYYVAAIDHIMSIELDTTKETTTEQEFF